MYPANAFDITFQRLIDKRKLGKTKKTIYERFKKGHPIDEEENIKCFTNCLISSGVLSP